MNRFNWKYTLPILALLPAIACGSDDDGGGVSAAAIKDQMPQGQIRGEAWTMTAAIVEPSSFGDDELSVQLFAEPVEACDGFHQATSKYVLFSVPNMPGEYPLRLDFSADSQTVTFVTPPSDNLIAAEGVITVDSVADGKVTIGLVANADASAINGRFTADLCVTP